MNALVKRFVDFIRSSERREQAVFSRDQVDILPGRVTLHAQSRMGQPLASANKPRSAGAPFPTLAGTHSITAPTHSMLVADRLRLEPHIDVPDSAIGITKR